MVEAGRGILDGCEVGAELADLVLGIVESDILELPRIESAQLAYDGRVCTAGTRRFECRADVSSDTSGKRAAFFDNDDLGGDEDEELPAA